MIAILSYDFLWLEWCYTEEVPSVQSIVSNTAGIDIFKTKYLCVTTGGMLAGLGGAFLSLGHPSMGDDWGARREIARVGVGREAA